MNWLEERAAQFSTASWLFLRALGLTTFCAFISIWVQFEGLLGPEGILPAGEYMDWVDHTLSRRGEGGSAWTRVPSLLWLFDTTDAGARFVLALGTAASLGVLLGICTRISAILAWVSYLSIVSVGQVFLGYQWDALLLETLLVAALLAPTLERPWTRFTPHWAPLALCWFLLFKLMFLSGWVKLASSDATWSNLTALEFHYWTQPLPAWPAYFVDSLPSIFHKLSAVGMFVIELVAPFLIFGPRKVRNAAAVALIALQILIAATGTYGFFNLLTITLCLLLFDDESLDWFAGLRSRVPVRTSKHRILTAVAALFFVLSSLALVERLVPQLTDFAAPIKRLSAPLRSFNNYGLFAVMTTERREIELHASADGVSWQKYEFEYKPDELDQIPAFATPHMPRLDWQMWFAALGTCRSNPWFIQMLERLGEDSRQVEKLFDDVPKFEPRYFATPVYEYRFAEERYWKRNRVGEFCPVLAFEKGELRRAPEVEFAPETN